MHAQIKMSPEDRTYHHGNLRAALLKSALFLIATEGGSALSLRGVAAHAGVSGSAPYRHFRDREALLAALASLGFEKFVERLEKARSATKASEEMNALARAYLTFAMENRALYLLMFTDNDLTVREDETLTNRSEAAFLLLQSAVMRRLSCQTATEARYYSTAIWAALHGAAMLSLDGRLTHKASTVKKTDFANKIAETLMEGVFAIAAKPK